MLKTWCCMLTPALLACGLSFHAAADSHVMAPSAENMVKRLGYTAEQIEALKQGKIVAIDVERSRGDQLIAAVAARIDAPLANISGSAKQGLNIQRDAGVLAFGAIRSPAESGAFDKLSYEVSETAEIKRFLGVRSGGSFNLSAEEITTLQAAFRDIKAGDDAAAATVSAAYRAVLQDRLTAYQQSGLGGIKPYDFGGKSVSPAEELQAVYDQVKPLLEEFFPDFGKALENYPEGLSEDIISQFYWIKRRVEGRPAVILAHQLVQSSDDYVLMAQRQFFVGHTYESLQVVALGLPIEGGTAVFYLNAAFTDKVTGFFSGVAQSVGQGRMKDDLEAYFDAVRKAYAQ